MQSFSLDKNKIVKQKYFRQFSFETPENLIITYVANGSSYEQVYVNDKLVNASMFKLFYNKLAFTIETSNIQVPAYIELNPGFLKIKNFRFVIGNDTIYSEGTFKYPAHPAAFTSLPDLSNIAAPDSKFKKYFDNILIILLFLPLLAKDKVISDPKLNEFVISYFFFPALILNAILYFKFTTAFDNFFEKRLILLNQFLKLFFRLFFIFGASLLFSIIVYIILSIMR